MLMFVFYLIFLAFSGFTSTELRKEIYDLLEEKGYVDKSRLERVQRLASGNVIEYSVTGADVWNWIKRNIWSFIPILNLFLVFAFCVRHSIYEKAEKEFYAMWVDYLISSEKVVTCSKNDFENIHMIEAELSKIRKDKILDFLKEHGIDISYTESLEDNEEDNLEELEKILEDQELEDQELEEILEEISQEQELEEQELEEQLKELLESEDRISSSNEEDEVDKFMEYFYRPFDNAFVRADRMVDHAMNNVDKGIDKVDQQVDIVLDSVDKAMDKVENKIDGAMDSVDKAIDKVDEILEKVLKL